MNIMLDIETLDTAATAVVLSIGAVAFTDDGEMCGDFYVELVSSLQDQIDAGRTISASTLLWWMQQGEQARKVFAKPPIGDISHMSVEAGLTLLNQFLWRHRPVEEIKVWGNGSDFDNVIVSNLYRSFNMEPPWSYFNNRCFRTLKKLPGAPDAPPRIGVHHNALDDAIHQTRHWTEITRWLTDRG